MDDLKPSEPYLLAPLSEISTGVVERIAEFNQHVERHEQPEHVFPTPVVYQSLYCDEGAPRRQCIIGGSDQVHLLLKIPIMQNHAHSDHVGFGQGILKEVARSRRDSL